jgi:Smg protein
VWRACQAVFINAGSSFDDASARPLGYSVLMFDVLVYLYENYWRPDACPEPKQLSRKLSAVGFEPEEIQDALRWLDGLADSAQSNVDSPEDADTDADATPASPASSVVLPSMRIYTEEEREVLNVASVGFLAFLESAGVLPPPMRELVIDRAVAVGAGTMDLEDLKVIVLMVFWSLGEEPDALILDELFVDPEDRLIH